MISFAFESIIFFPYLGSGSTVCVALSPQEKGHKTKDSGENILYASFAHQVQKLCDKNETLLKMMFILKNVLIIPA